MGGPGVAEPNTTHALAFALFQQLYRRDTLAPVATSPLRRLSHGAENLYQTGVFLAADVVLRCLSRRRRLAYHEVQETVVALDYPGAPLRLKIRSTRELKRTLSCAKEPETIRWMEANLRPGDTFYDAGANVGAYSLVASHLVGPLGCVVSFEPGAPSFSALVCNIGLNGCANIVPLAFALGSEHRRSTLDYPSALAGETTVGGSESTGLSQVVCCAPLDSLIETYQLPAPRLIKIDVDGAEPEVLRGATKTLAHPGLVSVLFEAYPDTPTHLDTAALLEAAGFRQVEANSHGTGRVTNYVYRRPD